MTAHGFESVPDEIDQMGDQYDLDKLVDHSARFEETQRNLFLKPWPTSHMCHMVVQSIEELVDENDLQPDDIISIKAGLPNVYLMPHQNNPHPARYWEAIYSTAWAFAMAVHRVPSGPDWFTDERIADAVCHATADKVEIVEDAAATAAYQALDLPAVDGWVEIKSTKGDLARSRTLNDTWGSPATPMPDDIFHGKFMRVTEPSLSTVGGQTLYDALQDIESCGAVSDISALM
jgi:2-methylcitrate dehydratase PrpD